MMALAMLVLCGGLQQACAADTLFADAKHLDPDVLVDLVLSRNADLEAARAAAAEAATRIKSTGVLDDPVLSYAIAPATVGTRDIGTRQSIALLQSLPWPGTLGARRAKAEAESEAAQSDAETRALEITSGTKAAFAEWAFIHAALRVNHQHQAHLRDLTGVAERRSAAGFVGQQDALKASMDLARMENEALMLESQRRVIKARLNALLNREPDAELPSPASLRVGAPLPSIEQLEEVAIARHPDLKGLAATVRANESGVTLAKKAFYPDLSVQAGYDEMWDQKEMRPSVGVSISVPLHWGRREADLAGARAAQKKAEWKLADRRATLLAGLMEAYAAAEQTIQSGTLYKERLLPLADAALSSALSNYKNGLGDFASVIDAAREKLDQEIALERVLADQYRALATLEQAAGGTLIETSTTPLDIDAGHLGDH